MNATGGSSGPTLEELWMARCMELAQEAESRGEAAVGAVIVRDETIIAEGIEEVKTLCNITAHAEMLAVCAACETLQTLDLSGCTLITNVEPCWMCAYVIREARIAKVVVGRPVQDIGGITSGYPILTSEMVPEWGPPPEILWVGIPWPFPDM